MPKIQILETKANDVITIPQIGSWPTTQHIFEEKSIWAVNAALTAQRPLLIRGEPGVGKSQLARAAAQALGRVFISEVVHARSECQDLLWHFDALNRLGEAQALGAACKEMEVKKELDPLKFLSPGALWWTFNWNSAQIQWQRGQCRGRRPFKPPDWTPSQGSVLLIDEIDKADADLPNGLLETLGNGAFSVPYLLEPFAPKEGVSSPVVDIQDQNHGAQGVVTLEDNAPPPLVVITTNEERELPSAFIRRCMVLRMGLPQSKGELTSRLCERGRIHFGDACSAKVRQKAADMLWEDRQEAQKRNHPAPGQAEYLDILRALKGMELDESQQRKALDAIGEFALKKYPEDYS